MIIINYKTIKKCFLKKVFTFLKISVPIVQEKRHAIRRNLELKAMKGNEESDIYLEETVDTIIKVLRILYNVAVREKPELLKGANDNEKMRYSHPFKSVLLWINV